MSAIVLHNERERPYNLRETIQSLISATGDLFECLHKSKSLKGQFNLFRGRKYKLIFGYSSV